MRFSVCGLIASAVNNVSIMPSIHSKAETRCVRWRARPTILMVNALVAAKWAMVIFWWPHVGEIC